MGISRIRRVMNSGLDVDIRTQANEHPHLIPYLGCGNMTTIRQEERWKEGRTGKEKEKQYCAAQHANSNSLEIPPLPW